MSTDAADVFCRIYDEFETERLNPHEVNGWLTDEQVLDIASFTEGKVIETGTLDEGEIRASIENAEDEADRRRFAYLTGIDNALQHAHPQTRSHDMAGLKRIALRYIETGRFDTGASPGALLPRFAFPADEEDLVAERLADAMISVVRVSAEGWHSTEHVRLPSRADFNRLHRERGVLFGCIPFIERMEDLTWEFSNVGGVRLLRNRIVPTDEVRRRISSALTALDEQGAMIGVVPELCASADVVKWWREEISENPPPRDSNLRWIFTGTGPVDPDQDPPRNSGVLLDRLTGEVLMSQDKLHAFHMSSTLISNWQLGDYVGEKPVYEDIDCGTKVTVAECELGRLSILICEDLARTIELGPPLKGHGISHIISPVFSDETELHHWEHNKAKDYADEIGTQVVVANSRVVGCIQGETLFGTALAHSPSGFAVGKSSTCDDIVLLRLSDEAAIWATARTAGFEDFDETPAS